MKKVRIELEEVGFEFDEKYDEYYIYKNKNAFPIGYYLAKNIEESYNPFKMQNEFLENLIIDNKDSAQEKYFHN